VGTSTGTGASSPVVATVKKEDPEEDALLASLEELAQKTDVLTRWADDMYEYVKAVPQSTLRLLPPAFSSHIYIGQNLSRIRRNSRNAPVKARNMPHAGDTPTSRPNITP
jgi:hypothetical protein